MRPFGLFGPLNLLRRCHLVQDPLGLSGGLQGGSGGSLVPTHHTHTHNHNTGGMEEESAWRSKRAEGDRTRCELGDSRLIRRSFPSLPPRWQLALQ